MNGVIVSSCRTGKAQLYLCVDVKASQRAWVAMVMDMSRLLDELDSIRTKRLTIIKLVDNNDASFIDFVKCPSTRTKSRAQSEESGAIFTRPDTIIREIVIITVFSIVLKIRRVI